MGTDSLKIISRQNDLHIIINFFYYLEKSTERTKIIYFVFKTLLFQAHNLLQIIYYGPTKEIP